MVQGERNWLIASFFVWVIGAAFLMFADAAWLRFTGVIWASVGILAFIGECVDALARRLNQIITVTSGQRVTSNQVLQALAD